MVNSMELGAPEIITSCIKKCLFEELGDSDGPAADLNARALSLAAILVVFLRVHWHSVIGSPAVSCRISSSIRTMPCGVFLHRIAARPGATDSVKLDVFCRLDKKRLGNGKRG